MKPLEGITVLEFSTMITASFAAMMMAEQGARVIKVETLEMGDPMRYIGSMKGGISSLFANCNRGKESIALDLKQEETQQLICDMVPKIDLVIHNFRPGVMDKLNLGSERLREINPRLVFLAISGFGHQGPMRDAPAYDPIIQAHAGFTASQPKPGEPPMFVRNLMCDKITAYTACQAATAAFYQREQTGEGQHIDLAMLDAGLFYIFPDAFMHHTLLDDDVIHQPPLADLLYDLTETKDGAVTISASTEGQRVRMMDAVGMLHLFADERFNTQEKLLANLTAFRSEVAEGFAKFTTEEVLNKMREADVPAASCLPYLDVLNQPQITAMGTMETVDHPLMGNMRIIKAPAHFGGERLTPSSNSPAHGQDTQAVLAEFGVSNEQFTQWTESGMVASAGNA